MTNVLASRLLLGANFILFWACSSVCAAAEVPQDPAVPVAAPAAPPAAVEQPAVSPNPAPVPMRPLSLAAPTRSVSEDDVAILKTPFRINNPARNVAFYAYAEVGALGFVQHTYQTGKNGTLFDLKTEGNQSTMFLFARLSAELELFKRHSFIFVYQPIDVRTQAVAQRDVSFDQTTFVTGTPLDIRYGFDFYRLTYQVDIFKSSRHELAFGLGGQLRNAKIVFTSVDGKQRSISDDLGFVPLLRVRARYTFQNGVWLGLEADGFYANVAVLNGGRSDVVGAIWDASIRVGMRLTSFMDTFVNLRYLGGGASGTSSSGSDNLGGDGYTYNWLHALVASIGFGIR